ncbi:type I phosphomannose isomerase catalytic subunit, partial [Vibrio cholerae]
MTQIPTQDTALPEAVFFPMTNPIQNYAWGSKTAFQQLFELENPTDEPQAELWM